MIYFLLFTAFTVSVDSFFCGFSLSEKTQKKLPIILGIALTVFIMCLIANYSASILSGYLNEKTASLGGIILILVGIYNLVKKDNDEKVKTIDCGIIKQSLIIGFAVGLDGALSNLSLAIMGINAFYVPVIIAVMHAIMITLGIYLSKTKLIKGVNKFGFLSPMILIVLGIYKLAGLFI